MKKCFVIFLLPLSINAFSQITYDSGYFVKESGEKINCLIRNKRWLDNPSDFNYKIETSGGDVLTETVDGVKEFGVGNMKYVKATVKIDTSNQQNSKLSYNRVPEWKEEPVFLKVLVEGKGTLYEYKDTNVDVFLFSVNGSPIEQLVYKVFLQRDTRFGGNNIYYSKNETYLNQLNASVTCGNRPEANGKNLPYVKSLLEKYFMNYNICNGEVMTKPASDQKFAFSIVTAYNWGNFQLGSAGFGATRSFEPAGAVSLGFRFEFIPPFHGYKWSIILEPTFQGNKSTYKSSGKVDYHTLEIPFGVKYSFYLSDRTALYLNGFLITDLPTNASATLGTETYHCTSPSISFAAGAGFVVGRFSIGARKYFERSALATTHKYFFVYDKVMLLVGFRVTTAAGKK